MNHLFKACQRYNRSFALLYIDLDRFKIVNDHYGHEAGDFLLHSFSKSLQSVLRETDTAARLGGDEFAIILPDINEAKANLVAYKLVNDLSYEVDWKGVSLSVSPSIGLATYHKGTTSHNDIMREADIALLRAKRNGRSQYSAFNKDVEREMRETQLLSMALPKAIAEQQLQLAWQPIINAETGTIDSVETLVRWHHFGNWVSPLKIIDLVLERRLGEVFHR